jgi:hypothetical protein
MFPIIDKILFPIIDKIMFPIFDKIMLPTLTKSCFLGGILFPSKMIKISFQMKNHVRMIFLSKIKMSSKFLMKRQAILNS